jgi:hypothetical protein
MGLKISSPHSGQDDQVMLVNSKYHSRRMQ